MARIIDAFSQFLDGNGQPLANGYLQFFQNKTAIPEPTYNDPDQTIVNPADVPLDGEGRMSLNAYASVLCTVKLFNSVDSQVDSEDDVTPRGGLASGAAFATWNSTINYQTSVSIVTGSDGNYYKAKQNTVGVDPVVDFAAGGANWERVYFNEFWSEFKTYSDKDVVTFIGDINNYISLKSSNLNNDPSVDGGVNWVLDNPVLNYSSGKTYFIGEQSFSTVDFRRYASQLSQAGNEPSVDSGNNWLPVDGKVNKPVNVLPADSSINVSRTPTLTADSFTVTGSDSEGEWANFQLSDDSFATIFHESGIVRDLTSYDVTVKLPASTLFSYRLERKGVRTDISEFSDVTTFTTTFPLAESYSDDLTTGTAAARTLVTQVDLSSQSGIVMITNKSTTDAMRVCTTSRGVGLATKAGVGDGETAEPTGLTSFNTDGYSVGALAAYNGSGDDIFSIILQQKSKFVDLVPYSGNETIRVLSHNLALIPGTYISMAVTGPVPSWHTRYNANLSSTLSFNFGDGSSAQNTASFFSSTPATSTQLSIGQSTSTNRIGEDYIAIVIANSQSSGVVSGEYTGTAASGNKIITGFKPSTIFVFGIDISGQFIFSLEMGTSTHIVFSATAESGVGSVQSFDSDGFTLSASLANTSGFTYYYMAFAETTGF